MEKTNNSDLLRVQFEKSMSNFGLNLERENRRIEGSSLIDVAHELEKDVIQPEWFKTINTAMIEMVEWKKQTNEDEVIYGPVFQTGADGGIGLCVLFPSDKDVQVAGMRLDDIVHGTPALIQFQSKDLSERWKGMSYSDKLEAVKREIQQKQQRVRENKAKMNINWGGWGSVPWYLLHRQQLVQRGVRRVDELQYELSVSMGLMGSAFTLNREGLRKNKRKLKGLKLSHFHYQLESALSGVGRMLDPTIDPEIVMKEAGPDLIGHSMGGYIALKAASRAEFHWPVIEAVKKSDKARIVADKPVMLGALEKNVPEWMKLIVDAPGYKKQVKLQTGKLGAIVKWGVKDWLWGIPGADSVRQAIGPNISQFREIFNQFLTPDKMWDGQTVFNGHFWNYFWDRAFHGLCVKLLDEAEGVMGSNTISTVGPERGRNGDRANENILPFLYVLSAVREGVLGHDITAALKNALRIEESHYHAQDDAGHHPDIGAIAWSLGLADEAAR